MINSIISTLFALLVLTSAKDFSPRDLIDEARAQLSELDSIVQAETWVGHSNLMSVQAVFGANSARARSEGLIDLQQEHETINSQVAVLKNLAANADISSCTSSEEQISVTYNLYVEQLNVCINKLIVEATNMTDGARYRLDTVITKVHNLEFQLNLCREDLLCVAPLITEIELDKVRLPQNIGKEVQAAQDLLTTLALSNQACADDNVSQYVTTATVFYENMAECVNRILG